MSGHCRCVVRIVAEARVAVHNAVGVEHRREHTQAAFPTDVDGECHRGEMPVFSAGTDYGAAVACAVHIAAGLVRYRVMLLIGVRTHWRVGNVDAVAVDVKLGARSGILHIVFAVVLRQPRTFDKSAEVGVAHVVFAEALPAVLCQVEVKKFDCPGLGEETTIGVEFLGAYRIDVRRAPEHIGATVVVDKQVGVLKVEQYAGSGFPVARLRVVAVEHAHASRRVAANVENRVFVVVRRRCVTALRIPIVRLDEVPVLEVGRMPITMGTGHEHIVFAAKFHNCGVGSRAIRDVLFGIVNHIGVVDIQRVAICVVTQVLRYGQQRATCQRYCCNQYLFHRQNYLSVNIIDWVSRLFGPTITSNSPGSATKSRSAL